MLNQFYKYLSESLITYLKNQSFEGGERFYLQFDNQDQVKDFYEVLKEEEASEPFHYQHEYGSLYETFALKLNSEVKVVVASTSENVTPDFLVTLRNQVGEQKDGWKNTALLSICHENLDSIKGGSSDLQKEGMPFNVKSILGTLKEKIDSSELNKADKEVLHFHLTKKLNEAFIQTSLWDYEEILGFLKQGKIKKEEYSRLGLFFDNYLDQYTPSQMKKRLEENYGLFEKVQHIHEYENLDTQLDKLFGEKGVQALKKDSWREEEYGNVKDWNEEGTSPNKNLNYVESPKKLTKEGLVFWDKPNKETQAGQRKRHVLIFNSNKETEINLTFEFDDRLKKEDIHKKSESLCTVSGKKLLVNLNPASGEASFHHIVYTHHNQSKSKYDFNICVVECSPFILQNIKTLYEVNVKSQSIVVNKKEEEVIFGDKSQPLEEVYLEEDNREISLADSAVKILDSSPAWNDDVLSLRINIDNSSIPFFIKEETSRVTPITGNRVWKLKREYQEDFEYNSNTNKLKQGTREFSAPEDFKQYLLMEQEWIEKEFLAAEKGVSHLEGINLYLDDKVVTKYQALLTYYKAHKKLPSLTYMDEELSTLSTEYVKAFTTKINNIPENSILGKELNGLFKLGTIIQEDKVLLTPLHPLNVAYQIQVQNVLKSETIDLHILDRLNPNNLLPYIYDEKGSEVYRPVSQLTASEWRTYEPLSKVAVGESSAFLANVVEEKLIQFKDHFQYLFIEHSKSPIHINVINISNDHEVVRGLINFVKKQIDKEGPAHIIPIEVALYKDGQTISAFEKFSEYDNTEEFENAFNVSLDTKQLDKADVLRLIRENVLYYRPLEKESFGYAHISFYKMISSDAPAKNTIEEIETGTSLGGLLSSLSFLETEHDYRRGFGTKNAPQESNLLLKTATALNELASNLESGGTNPYRKNETIVTRTANYDEDTLNQLFNSSYWVTFIEPNVDLNFFQSSGKLLVIHYSDQYSSSTQYDAITVTDKSAQYKLIIEQYLSDKDFSVTNEQIETAIKSFNSLNGEWLLRIIGSKGQFSREKLSIISAIKYIMSVLNHDDIIWVPISLEEVLRIAGAVRLTKSEGVFSAKNLNVKGMHSDDLLLIGVETKEDNISLHYYPVEVKIGKNSNSTLLKAKGQIDKTSRLLNSQLAPHDEDGNVLFRNQFFRNFFIQLLISNAEKLITNKIWPQKEYEKINGLKEKLLNDQYEISHRLRPHIGKGAILSFKKEENWRAVKLEDDILMVELTEEDGYSGVMVEVEDLKSKILSGETDIKVENLLSSRYKVSSSIHSSIDEAKIKDLSKIDNQEESHTFVEAKEEDSGAASEAQNNQELNPISKKLEEIRVLLGTVEGSTKEIHWEYGNPELANRHLLISGKSGQGKSYFIQCLLLELARSCVSNVIFDYTDGFKSSKLEPQFKEQLGGNLEQFIVARDGFPINPFKRNKKELDEDIYIDEDNTDIAERIKGVFSSIYKDLGIQQQNAIYEAVLRGLSKYEDDMNLELLISELEEENSGPAKTARSQIKPLIDKNPFKANYQYNWEELLSKKGKVFIVQLTGYNREVQMMITEFILWDMWNHQLNHGDKSRPLPVILDEAQNLDHRESSPSAKILTEGRKFGWSGWYATQSLRGQFSIDEISRLQNASQKVYFMPPENEISAIAANLSQDSATRKEWERKLSTLKKGQCVITGPILHEDGTLKQNFPVVINISSLDERI